MKLNDLKKLAARDGFSWIEVVQLADELIAQAESDAWSDHEIRREVYRQTAVKGKEHLPFWKGIGQWDNPRFNGAFGGGNDYTVIPGWDLIAAGLALRFPELDRDDDCCGALYKLICSKPAEIPSPRTAARMALERITGQRISEIIDRHAAVPF